MGSTMGSNVLPPDLDELDYVPPNPDELDYVTLPHTPCITHEDEDGRITYWRRDRLIGKMVQFGPLLEPLEVELAPVMEICRDMPSLEPLEEDELAPGMEICRDMPSLEPLEEDELAPGNGNRFGFRVIKDRSTNSIHSL